MSQTMNIDGAVEIDGAKVDELVQKAVGDFGAVLVSSLIVVGDRLGLFRAMADGQPITSAELAGRTGTNERNVREWLNALSAAGYLTYAGDARYFLGAEQALLFTDEDSHAFVMGGFQVVTAAAKADEKLTAAFAHGHGIGWHEHHHDLFTGTERFFRPGYRANLVAAWIPALEGVEDRLRAGATVADIGCGHGASTIIMAEAYPNSNFVGFDYHAPSIAEAADTAARAGVADRTEFAVASAKEFTGSDYDLVCFFDCLHDMGDPVGALAHTRSTLRPDGTVLLVEPYAGDDVDENLNPVGRVFYAASSLICTPASQSQEVGLALGAQAGPARLIDVARRAGFTRARVAATTPFNLVLELRP
ncbi:MAG: class I SAM-dependent methyltransferase [Acidimicrobiales bacterium]